MIQYACASGWQREWLKGSNGFNCHNRITQINRGQATHLDYMCTCAVSEPLTGAIVLAGGCAKSITQTDPWCWTSWKSWLVSGIHVPAQHSSCRLAARWAGWGSVALSLLRAYLQITLIWDTVQRRTEERRDHGNNETWRFISSKQWNVMYFNTSCSHLAQPNQGH